MFCNRCGSQMPEGTRFCTNCGAPMEEKKPEVVEVRRKGMPGWAIALIIVGASSIAVLGGIILVILLATGMLFSPNNNAPTVIVEDEYEEYEDDDYEYEYEEEDDDDYSYNNQDYVLPFSSSRYITESDLYGLTKEECRIARNEIYARHGRMFKDAELQAYFNSKSWYTPSIPADSFQESMLNVYERENKDVILQYERDQGWY